MNRKQHTILLQEFVMVISLPPLFHVGIVVADMERASRDFERLWGVSTVSVVDVSSEGALYRGRRVDLTSRYGFLRTGASDIELIQPLSAVSPYRDFLETNGGDGVHHLAYRVRTIDAHLDQLREAGEPEVVLDAPLPGGGRFVYVGGAAHGPIIELIEMPEG